MKCEKHKVFLFPGVEKCPACLREQQVKKQTRKDKIPENRLPDMKSEGK